MTYTTENDHQIDGSATASGDTGFVSDTYLLLDVPHYDDSNGTASPPRTYLRLGSAIPNDYGHDMLTAVGITPSTELLFKDDYRNENSQTHPSTSYTRWDGHCKSSNKSGGGAYKAKNLTAELLTRGGWRLHTDGNYVSTTRGDRVDVIYGNYKLVVLGRMNGPDFGETYWDSSGGHTRWATNTQGDLVMVEWQTDRWRTYEETVKGHNIERFEGIQEEVIESPIMVSMIGSSVAIAPGGSGGTAIAASAKSDSTGAHTQTDQATGWLNPSSGTGTGRPRKQVKPVVEETVRAYEITEETTVTTAQGGDSLPAGFLCVIPVSDTIRTRASAAASFDPVTAVSGTPFGALHAPSGHISSYTVITDSKTEFLGGGLLWTGTWVDGNKSVHEETGFAPADAMTPAGRALAKRVNTLDDFVFTLFKFSTANYTQRTVKPFGGWTFNLSVVNEAASFSLGFDLTTPNFLVPDFARFSFKLGFSVLIAGASYMLASADVFIGASIGITTNKQSFDLGPDAKGGTLLEIKAFTADQETSAIEQAVKGTEMTISSLHLES